MLSQKYLNCVQQILNEIGKTQSDAIGQAADIVAAAIAGGGKLFLFGTGHSHILAEEAFYRAGGLVHVNPILEPAHAARRPVQVPIMPRCAPACHHKFERILANS